MITSRQAGSGADGQQMAWHRRGIGLSARSYEIKKNNGIVGRKWR